MPKATRRDIDAARTLVRNRDSHLCQLCGRPLEWVQNAQHHRRWKGMGGSAVLERASVLISVCGQGNKDLCHGEIHGNPEHAHDIGWILWATDDPETTPILTFQGWRLLDDEGGWSPCESPLLEVTP